MKLTALSALALATAASLAATHRTDTSATTEAAEVTPAADADRYTRLTLDDYSAVADELGISVACIRAVVEIETGNRGEGFGPDSLPLINFDATMFRKYARLRGIDPGKYRQSHPEVFAKPDVRRHGSLQKAQYARLHRAMEIDTVAALEGTFWGMFQIGGFNWQLCGCDSVQQFVQRMAYSEREQLELFAAFVRARKLDRWLVKRDWAAFALRYNGPGYHKLNYDTRMARAYRKYLNEENP